MKDILIFAGIIFLINRTNKLSLLFPDIIGFLFLIYLTVNTFLSPSDNISSLFGLRSYAIPVLIYFYGRLSFLNDLNLKYLIRLLLVISFVVTVISLGEYAFVLKGYPSLKYFLANYYQEFYGHGSPTGSLYSPGFLDMINLSGIFGNNLIMSAYLRFSICLLIFFLVYFKIKWKMKYFYLGVVLTVASVFTLSRYGIAALFTIIIISLFQRHIFSHVQKIALTIALIITVLFTIDILSDVTKQTVNVNDESTYEHIESIKSVSESRMTLFGNGLGTGVHSKGARLEEKISESEGLITQAMPEIGMFGAGIFILFTLSVIFSLLELQKFHKFSIRELPPQFFIALPLIFELIRIPLDIALRSFLASGFTWFLMGAFITRNDYTVKSGPTRTPNPV